MTQSHSPKQRVLKQTAMVAALLAFTALSLSPATAQTPAPAAGTAAASAAETAKPEGKKGAGRGMKKFKEADKNADGKIDAAEKQALINDMLAKTKERMEKRFAKMDANNDGAISQDEWQTGHQKRKRDKE